jgi:hypothetical protein
MWVHAEMVAAEHGDAGMVAGVNRDASMVDDIHRDAGTVVGGAWGCRNGG